jgi:short-subunit dehydrogenase involved in D-alanine esterification of teichoic acids
MTYNKALIIGATSGIGWGLAIKLLSQGTHVILVGRRQDRLDAFTAQHGTKNVTTIAIDATDLPAIPSFANNITSQHPDIDCLVLNSGIQRAFDFSNPSSIDLTALDKETMTNYTSHVHMTTAFLTLFIPRQRPVSFIYVSATLALVPGLLRTINYNSSKAALHTFILNLRLQMSRAGQSQIKIVEVFPPAVQTEIHDAKHQPDLVDGGSIGMPLNTYIEEMVKGLEAGKEEFAVGHGTGMLEGFEAERKKQMEGMIKTLDETFVKYLKK